jgi:hypothetical protein
MQHSNPSSSGNNFLFTGFLAFLYLLGDNQIVNQSLRSNQGSQFLNPGSQLLADIQGRNDEVCQRQFKTDTVFSASAIEI